MTDPNHITWAMVQPTLDEHLDALRANLETAPLDQVLTIQSQICALRNVQAWFLSKAENTRIFPD